jgi:hypothetical protein
MNCFSKQSAIEFFILGFCILSRVLYQVYRPSSGWLIKAETYSGRSAKYNDRLCGLVVRVLGYRSGGPGSIPGITTKKRVVGLERGQFSLVSTTEGLLDRKVTAPVYKTENTAVRIRHAAHVVPSIRKSWQSLRRQAAVARSV